MKIGIHHKGTIIYEYIPARSKIIHLLCSLKTNYPELFNDQKIRLYKDKNLKKKLNRNEKISTLIIKNDNGLEYSSTDKCNIFYTKITKQNNLWNRIKITFSKNK